MRAHALKKNTVTDRRASLQSSRGCNLNTVAFTRGLLGGQEKARCTVSDRAQHQFFKLNGWSVKEIVGSITTRNFENLLISVVSLAIAEQLSV